MMDINPGIYLLWLPKFTEHDAALVQAIDNEADFFCLLLLPDFGVNVHYFFVVHWRHSLREHCAGHLLDQGAAIAVFYH
jgi:hypothetical protein